jgi:hypothetical protein
MDAIREIRARRAHVAGLVDEVRLETYGSALEQFEQLISAARGVGYASRPLLLFYAVSQASRALAAVQLAENWVLRGHGLGWHGESSSELLDRRVAPKPGGPRNGSRDAFSGLCEAVASPLPTKPMELGAMVAALPDIDVPLGRAAVQQWPGPLKLVFEMEVDDSALASLRRDIVGRVVGTVSSTPQQLVAELARYPAAAQAVPDSYDHQGIDRLVLRSAGPDGLAADIAWPAPPNKLPVTAAMDAIAPRYWTGERVLLPDVGEAGGMRPIAIWAALLYALSMLARYEPAAWRQALDADRSTIAATLEATIDAAAQAVPQLVLEALRTDPFTILKRAV